MAARAGKITVKMGGVVLEATGSFTFNLGHDKRAAIVGSDRVQGCAGQPQVPSVEDAGTDGVHVYLTAQLDGEDLMVTLDLDQLRARAGQL